MTDLDANAVLWVVVAVLVTGLAVTAAAAGQFTLAYVLVVCGLAVIVYALFATVRAIDEKRR